MSAGNAQARRNAIDILRAKLGLSDPSREHVLMSVNFTRALLSVLVNDEGAIAALRGEVDSLRGRATSPAQPDVRDLARVVSVALHRASVYGAFPDDLVTSIRALVREAPDAVVNLIDRLDIVGPWSRCCGDLYERERATLSELDESERGAAQVWFEKGSPIYVATGDGFTVEVFEGRGWYHDVGVDESTGPFETRAGAMAAADRCLEAAGAIVLAPVLA